MEDARTSGAGAERPDEDEQIYLDANATTPIHPRVRAAMEPYLDRGFGNPSSGHQEGARAAQAVRRAREQLAGLLACHPDELVFTGGGSEADNLALKGVAWARRRRGRHMVISSVEHPAVAEPARFLEREGWQVSVVGVDRHGRVSAAAVQRELRSDTVLVSAMHANNETGSLNPVAEIGGMCRERGILFHTDAAQSVGKVPTLVDELAVDLLTVAAHKLYGPKGVGALYVRRGVELEPLIHGAGHEGGRRAGTENVLGVVGLGEAASLALDEGLALFAGRVRARRDRLHQRLREGAPGLVLNGHPHERLPNTLNVSFRDGRGDRILAAAAGVAASTGSACHAGEETASAVLLAMGLPPEVALGAVRLSLGLFTTEEEVERAASLLLAAGGPPLTPQP
jgi:cysteine desulfurase